MDLPVTSIPGFVWAQHFHPASGRSERLAGNADIAALCQGEGFVWLHLGLSDARVPAFLDSLAGLSGEACQALISRDTHARLSVTPELVCGTLVDFQRGFDELSSDLGWMHFAITERMIVTSLQKLQV